MISVKLHFGTRKRGVGILAFLLLMLWNIPSVVALTWTIETPYSPAAVKGHNSIALDSNNEPHISFYATDYTSYYSNLWMASKSGTLGWWTDMEDPSSGVGKYNAIAINPDSNTKHISYYDGLNGDLRHFLAGISGTSWEIVDSAGDVGKYTDITLDSGRYPHISYYDSMNGNLKYARYECGVSGCNWAIETVAPAGNFISEGLDAQTAIALDSTDNPHIIYTGGFSNGRRLRHAWKSGGIWYTEEIGIQSDCLGPSLAIDSSDNLYVSYIQYYAPSKWLYVRYATKSGAAWSTEQVAPAGDLGPYYPGDMGLATSIALDSTNQPHISYPYGAGGSQSMDYDLMYAKKGAYSWLTEVVDIGTPAGIYPGDVGRYSSITLSPDNLPHISYYDRANGYLKYATVSNILTVTKAGTGSGTVTSSPAGINCGTDCIEPYSYGTVVTLVATPDVDSTFAGWSGACTGTGACIVAMDANKSVTATFNTTLPPVSVTLVPDSTSIPRGGTLGYTVTVTNNTSTAQTFQYWTYVTLPNGSRYPTTGELFGPVNVTLNPGQTGSAHLTHGIPASAPLGTYIYYGNVGPYPTIWDSDSFTFTVTATATPGTRQNWELLENNLTK